MLERGILVGNQSLSGGGMLLIVSCTLKKGRGYYYLALVGPHLPILHHFLQQLVKLILNYCCFMI
jgi:hypothetical protein